MADPVIDYADVQGTILRGYRVDMARHFVLENHQRSCRARADRRTRSTAAPACLRSPARCARAQATLFRQPQLHLSRPGRTGPRRRRAGHVRRRLPARRGRRRDREQHRRHRRQRTAAVARRARRRRAGACLAQRVGQRLGRSARVGQRHAARRLRRMHAGAAGAGRKCPARQPGPFRLPRQHCPTQHPGRAGQQAHGAGWPGAGSDRRIPAGLPQRERRHLPRHAGPAVDQQQLCRFPHPRAGCGRLRSHAGYLCGQNGTRSGTAGGDVLWPMAQRQSARTCACRARRGTAGRSNQ